MGADSGFDSTMGATPTFDEVERAARRLNNWKASGDNGVIPESFSNPNNYRGIMLLDISMKIVSSIITDRILNYMKEIGMDEQTGFSKEKGCQNGYAALSSILRRRAEHNQSTWILFIDLVKAFDTVNRSHLMVVLKKLGLPKELVDVVAMMHEDVKVKFAIEDVEAIFDSTVGVKQGDNLAPVLFVMYMQVVMETLKEKWPDGGFLTYRAKEDGVMAGKASDVHYLSWTNLAADEDVWTEVMELVRSEMLSYEPAKLERKVLELKNQLQAKLDAEAEGRRIDSEANDEFIRRGILIN